MMYYLYGSRPGKAMRLVATFGAEEQLLAYVHWATVSIDDDVRTFEKGSALASCHKYQHSSEPLTNDDPESVDHNPTPSML